MESEGLSEGFRVSGRIDLVLVSGVVSNRTRRFLRDGFPVFWTVERICCSVTVNYNEWDHPEGRAV